MKKTPKEILEQYKPKKPNPFIYFIFKSAIALYSLLHPCKVNFNFDIKEYKNKQLILLGDHSSRSVYYFTFRIAKYLKPFNVLVGYQNFFDKILFNLFIQMGVIPKYLYIPDTRSVKNTLRLIKEGCSIALYPEGIQSMIGCAHPMNPATLKFLKQSKLDVILAVSNGAYLKRNRYQDEMKKGPVEINYYVLFKKEELETMSIDEMYERYKKFFQYNDFAYNEIAKNKYVGKVGNAKNIEQILFYCPACHKQHTLTSNDTQIICTNCHEIVNVSDTYAIDSKYYKRLDYWYYDQRRIVKEEIANPDFKFEYDTDLYQLHPTKLLKEKSIKVGSGHVTITHEKLTYVGTRNDQPFTLDIPIEAMPSIVIYPGFGNEFYFENEYYEFVIPNNPNLGTKIMIIVEELHNLKDPVWKRVCDDYYNIK